MRPLLALAVALVFAPVAFADDLLQVFDRALLNDPQIREADANRLANRESKPQALAALLPQLNGSASISKNDNASFNQSGQLIGGQLVTFGGDSRSKPDSRSWSINLTQSVFSWADWVALRQANKRVAQAEADYQAAQQDLVQRVATRYFDVLAAQDSVTAQQAALEAFTQLLDQADKRFEVGLIAITDVQEARAARDTSAAALIAAKRQLSTAEQFLQEIVGIASGPLAAPAESMPLKTPNPADADAWVNLSMSQNLALTSSRLAADIARDNVRSAFGGHLPQLDLVASRGNNHSESTQVFVGGVTAPSLNDQDSKSVGL
ncbi:MAG: TolC family protein, partial [Pseudomonadales bacterium]|nr:TolC family protein [Pseudomonadales bacterium]